jgi:acyl-CoA synthetase (AMP-forming)/AMP-acid ligase II
VSPDDAPTIPDLVRGSALRFGRREYLTDGDHTVTYAGVDEQSRRLAKQLVRAGAGKGTRIGMLFGQGPDFAVALFGITRIGGIAVPLSTFLRGPELQRAVRHADVAMLVAPRTLTGRDTAGFLESVWPELSTAPGPALYLGDAPYLRAIRICGGADRPWATDAPDLAALADDTGIDDTFLDRVEAEVVPSDVMVMIYTSGATAEPKAVVHTHGAQVRHSANLARLYGFTGDERTFTNMPFFWVGGLTVSLLAHMHAGGTVITSERADAQVMLDVIERTKPTRVLGWSLVDRITSDPALADRDLEWLVALQPAELMTPGRRHNSLGMSETCGPHTAASPAANADELPEHLLGSFGPPVPGVQHKIVDPETGATLAAGEEGEICVRGYSLMDGLHKRERSDTFDEDGWYHTGDGGFLRDGLLFFTGRRTEMIKTAGANVAPREVELAVESLPGVQAAFVVGLPDAERGELVGCLVCPEPGHDLDPDALRAALRDVLSSYKIPRKFMLTRYEDAPWLPSGKISKPRIAELLLDAP